MFVYGRLRLPSRMKTRTLLVELFPRSFCRWRTLPLFGSHLDDLMRSLRNQGYAVASIRNYVNALPELVRWLQRKGVSSLAQVSREELQAACTYYRSRKSNTSCAVSILIRFFCERGIFAERETPLPSPTELQLDHFAKYLCDVRGLVPGTIAAHMSRLRCFLQFLNFDQNPGFLRQLQIDQIEAFLQSCARTNNRFSMQHVVATIRAFLQRQHALGILPRTLHLQIDTPRVYRLERLPRAISWNQVEALLCSIDRSEPHGMRDFTLLYLGAAYGLRSGELVRLTLDDIDWRDRTLHVAERKNRRASQLPLTDEAANILISYLRKARPQSSQRQLFLRMRAPGGPLKPTAVHDILEHRIKLSGLELPQCGSHMLRHSFALNLLRQGVGMKTIGDALGHRDIESTFAYLRLDVDDLREVALPAPAPIPASSSLPLVPACDLPPIRAPRANLHLPKCFQSLFAASLQRYLDVKRALGRAYTGEAATLSHWDAFLRRRYPQARKVRAEMFYGWTEELTHLSPVVRRNRQRVVRNFLLYYARDHAGTFIPDIRTFPKSTPAQPPRLVSETEMARLIQCARQLPPSRTNPLRAETIRLGLILLFCCGLRRGELLRIKLGDVDRNQNLIRIVLTKFHKSRLVPLAPSVAGELDDYLQRRHRSKLPMTPDSFLLWSGRCFPEVYAAQSLRAAWHQLCATAEVLDAWGHPPRLHDLRHSFAANVLNRWYTQGLDVQTKLPHLATYLGHVSPVSTHYYLQFTPELRQSAGERFHRRFAHLFTVGGIAV
jgi:integrase/recombinase XerD